MYGKSKLVRKLNLRKRMVSKYKKRNVRLKILDVVAPGLFHCSRETFL
jgi:hypothetical protein